MKMDTGKRLEMEAREHLEDLHQARTQGRQENTERDKSLGFVAVLKLEGLREEESP